MDAGLEGFGRVCLHADSHYLPSFSFTLNEGILRGDRLVAVHVQVDFFRSGIAVVPEHDLLGGFHGFHLRPLDADRNRCGASGLCPAAVFKWFEVTSGILLFDKRWRPKARRVTVF